MCKIKCGYGNCTKRNEIKNTILEECNRKYERKGVNVMYLKECKRNKESVGWCFIQIKVTKPYLTILGLGSK